MPPVALPFEVVPIPGGAFLMGSATGRPDEQPVHEVHVAPFWMARTPVTRAQYAPFVAAAGAARPPWWDDPAFGDGAQPVVGVTWLEAVEFAAWLSSRDGGR